MILVLDIDGTLANVDHRKDLADAGRWNEFHNPVLVEQDSPNVDPKIFRKVISAFDDLILLTGRPSSLKVVTQRWLQKHLGLEPQEYKLYMQPNNNFDPPVVFKEGIIRNLSGSLAFVDDNPENLQMMKQYGLVIDAKDFIRYCNDVRRAHCQNEN